MQQHLCELFVPGKIYADEVKEWTTLRGMYIWDFMRARPYYPDGVKNTPWSRIVWCYKVFKS